MEFIYYLKEIKSFQILLIVIVMDIVFGTLRAIKDKSLNSTFGINGIIRKVRNDFICHFYGYNSIYCKN